MLVHHVGDGDDARLHRQGDEEPGDPQPNQPDRRVEGRPSAPGAAAPEEPRRKGPERAQEEDGARHVERPPGTPDGNQVVHRLAVRQDEQPEVGHHHHRLGAQVVEPPGRRDDAGGGVRRGQHPGGGGAQVHEGEGDEERDGGGRQDGKPAPPAAGEEGPLHQRERDREGEGDLLRARGEQGGEEHSGVGEPSPGFPLAKAPDQVEDRRRQVEEGGEQGDALDHVAHRLGCERVGDEEGRSREGDRRGRGRERRIAHPRGPEGEDDEGLDEQRVAEMDGQVDDVPAEWLVSVQGVVQREGEVGHESVREHPVDGGTEEGAEVPDGPVLDQLLQVVEDELAVKGVRVGEDPERDHGQRGQRGERGSRWGTGLPGARHGRRR